jgi:hypothetical protein
MAYGDDTGFQAWLDANGLTLTDGAPSIAALRYRGSSYIDNTYGAKFCGVPAGGFDQANAWPRTGGYAHGTAIPDDVVPLAVINASYAAAYTESVTPGSLSTSYTPGTAKVLTKVDKLEWEVIGDATAEGSMVLRLSAVEGLLAPFLCPTGSYPAILVV